MAKNLHKDVCESAVFERLYRTLSKDVHNFLYYKFGADAEPADKTQEAFIKLWENCKKVTPDKAKAFLFTTASNLMLNTLKHKKVVLKHQQQSVPKHTNEDPEFIMRSAEYYERYKQVLASLTEEQRVAFTLSKIEGKKQAEIAEILGVTKKVVEYRIYSAFAVLKEQLENFRTK
ncbi:RNA polymerase sigma factor [Gilvibacter sp.]|uniref:RNA polymerase sigma factor n=1 Tax=Gilvibacter sp. TaxID=2729997 RepID=UPI003F4A5442